VNAVELLPPGVYELSDEEYFGPQLAGLLSSTGARALLKPGGPGRFRYKADTNTVETKREFDLGHAFHTLTLGAGPQPILFPGTGANPEAWQKADDKAAVEKLRADGKVPLRPKDYAAAVAMSEAVHQHPLAAKLLRGGKPEQTLVWADKATGVLCKAKADWLRPDGMVDVKSAQDASEEALSKAAHGDRSYAVQAAFYLRGFRDRFPGSDPFFEFITVEKEPPYLVHVNQLTERAMAYGDQKVSEALEIYAACTESGEWPGYPLNEITDIDLPAWLRVEGF
jgi:hypothetical protein